MNIGRIFAGVMSSREKGNSPEIQEHISAESKVIEAHLKIASQWAVPKRDAYVEEHGVNEFYPLMQNPGIALIGKIVDTECANPHLQGFFSNVIIDPKCPKAIYERLKAAQFILQQTAHSQELPRILEHFLRNSVQDIISENASKRRSNEESQWEKLSREFKMPKIGLCLFTPAGLHEYLNKLIFELDFARIELVAKEQAKLAEHIRQYQHLANLIKSFLARRQEAVHEARSNIANRVTRVIRVPHTQDPEFIDATTIAQTVQRRVEELRA